MFRPGDDLGRYRVVKTIGLGGMGIVYQGRDTVLGRDVAIKAMTGAVASDEKMRQRFLQELENAPRVVHPFVTTVFDVVDRPEGPLLVMELVEGLRFDHFCEEKQPPLPVVARFGAEVAEALTAIHAVGMAHRDLKPGNVLVTPDGHPKVMDFGVALRLPGFDRTDLATSAQGERHTDSGAVVGTIAYMSPEQLRGEEPDERSDLFALGIMLFEGVTGHHPFPGDTSAEIAGSILHELPGTVEDRHKLHECGTLGTTILRLLDKNPKERLGTAREAASLLHQATAHWSSPGLPARRRTFRAIGGSVLVALAVGGVIYGLRDQLFGPGSSSSGAIAGTVRPAVAIIPFESAAGGPGAGTGLMVADLLAAQLGESARLRPVATDRIAECLEALPAGTAASARRARLAQATPATWIVSGTLYGEGDEILASIAVFARDSSDPVTSFQIRAKRPSELSTKAFQRLQETTGAEDLASFLPRRKAPLAPGNPESADLLRRARAAARNLDYTKGIDLLDDALRRDPKFLDAQILLANLLARSGYERRATQVADHAIELATSMKLPVDARQSLEARLARASIDGGAEYTKALGALAKRYPDEPEIVREYAVSLRRSEPDKARELAKSMIELDPADGRNHLALARVLAWQQKVDDGLIEVDQAEALFKALDLGSAVAEASRERGRVLSRGSRWDLARASFGEASRRFKAAGAPTLALAASVDEANMALKALDFDVAQSIYKAALPELEAAGHFSSVVFAWEGYGSALMRLARSSEAEVALDHAVRAARSIDNPRLGAVALLDLAWLYTQTNRFSQARALGQEILTQPPDGAAPTVRCSAVIVTAVAEAALGRLVEAMERLDRQIGSDAATCGVERIAGAAAYLGWIAVEAEDPSRAIVALDRAVSLLDGPKPPADLSIYLADRSRVRAQLGALADSEKDLARAELLAGDTSGRGTDLQDDLRLARATLATARNERKKALAEAAIVGPGSGPIREALIALRIALLIAEGRLSEAGKLLGPEPESQPLWETERLTRRRLSAELARAEGRRGDALLAAQAVLVDAARLNLSRSQAHLAEVAARATASKPERELFFAQRDTELRKYLEKVPPEFRSWVGTHWGIPGIAPTPAGGNR